MDCDKGGNKTKKNLQYSSDPKTTPAPAVASSQITFIRALCTTFTILQPAKLHIRELWIRIAK